MRREPAALLSRTEERVGSLTHHSKEEKREGRTSRSMVFAPSVSKVCTTCEPNRCWMSFTKLRKSTRRSSTSTLLSPHPATIRDSLSHQAVCKDSSAPVAHVPNHAFEDQRAVRVGAELQLLASQLGERSCQQELTICTRGRRSDGAQYGGLARLKAMTLWAQADGEVRKDGPSFSSSAFSPSGMPAASNALSFSSTVLK